MKHTLIIFLIIAFSFFSISSTNCPNYCLTGTITASSNVYTLAYSGNSGCSVNGWRSNSSFSSENYLVRWVFADGGNTFRTSSVGALSPNLSVNSSQQVAFTNAVNTYGDDDDAGIVVGGGLNGNLPSSGLNVNSFPSSQNNIIDNQLIKITSAHTTNKAEKCNQVMLIITINNETLEEGRPGISENNLRLHLFHNTQVNKITFLAPGPSSHYYAFANVNTSNSYTYNNLNKVAAWDINNNFSGGEKNIYCLLELTDNFNSLDLEKVTFTAVLTNTNNSPINSSTGIDNYDLFVGSSFDPNIISVDKQTTLTCGEAGPEEYIYTVQFQNIGSAAASSVFINLETDKAIDPKSITVLEAVIGNGSNLYSNNTQLYKDCNFTDTSQKFSYSRNNIRTAMPLHVGAVEPNISFNFRNITLDGLNNPDVSASIGYVKFKAKTKLPFSSLNNRAGIFFDSNSEIITNLAVTKCLDESAVNMNTAESNDNCDDNKNCWICWLGWLIALILFVILIIKRRKKRE